MKNRRPLCRVSFYTLICSVFISNGCHQNTDKNEDQQKAVLRECDAAFVGYANADLGQARAILTSNVQMLEADQFLTRSGRASILYQNYSRLYVLETRAGEAASANLDLIKARYWLIRELELGGVSEPEIKRRLESAGDEAIIREVDKLDKINTDGKGPHYVIGLSNKQTTITN